MSALVTADGALAVVLLVVVALHLVRSLRRGRFSIRDRVGAALETLGVVAVFAAARVGVDWTEVPTAVWVVAAVVAAGGLAALVCRVPTMPVLRQVGRGRRARRIARASAGALVGLAVISVAAATWSG